MLTLATRTRGSLSQRKADAYVKGPTKNHVLLSRVVRAKTPTEYFKQAAVACLSVGRRERCLVAATLKFLQLSQQSARTH